jgi:murein DD-endopeptidase MepM/ murein hydrolase activator NlpD
MKIVYHRYNSETCQFEPVFPSGGKIVKRTLLYLLLSLLTALPSVYWYINKYSSLQEQQLIHQNNRLVKRWDKLITDADGLNQQLDSLAWKDDTRYRVLLDLNPLSQEERNAGAGGNEKIPAGIEDLKIIQDGYYQVDKLKNQMQVAQQSFEQLSEATKHKNRMLASRPAIQPIDKKQLTTLHLTFGTRLHPIFNVLMDHKGLDFSAGFGTPVYATADGRVSMAYYSNSYGNVVYIDHGFEYETRYAHLQKFNVQPGNFVKRGDIIGFVGNTGISAAPHLHYEVFLKGKPVNPIHFFQRDLSQAEFQKIIQPTSATAP